MFLLLQEQQNASLPEVIPGRTLSQSAILCLPQLNEMLLLESECAAHQNYDLGLSFVLHPDGIGRILPMIACVNRNISFNSICSSILHLIENLLNGTKKSTYFCLFLHGIQSIRKVMFLSWSSRYQIL